MSDPKNIIPVYASEIEIGRPLPWAVYDANGTMMLNEGVAPVSKAQINAMIERGLFRRGCPGADRLHHVAKHPIPPGGLGPSEGESKSRLAGDPIPFDDLAMQPGEILQMHPALEVVADDLPVVLIGYLKNRAIVVTTPVVAGKPLLVKDGTLFNIKTFSGTSLYSFRARVQVSYSHPMPHLHLEYPKLVYATKIRKALRAAVDLPATLQDPASGHRVDAVIKDLSVGGAKLMLHEQVPCEQNARFIIGFRIGVSEDIVEEIAADAVVRCVESRTENEKTVHTVGLQFGELPKSANLAIMALVYRMQLRRKG